MKTRITRLFIMAVAISAMVGSVHAGVLLEWDFDGIPSGNGGTGYGESPFAPTWNESGFSSTGLERGEGVGFTGVSMSHAWGGRNYLAADANEALEEKIFFVFDVIAAEGFTMSLDSIQTPWYGSPLQSPSSGLWQYSVDGGDTWENIGGTRNLPSEVHGTGGQYDWVNLDLKDIDDLQDIYEAMFRLVIWGGGGASGGRNGRFYLGTGTAPPIDSDLKGVDNTLTVWGTFTAIPEPSAVALLVLSGAAILLRRRKP